MSGPESTSWSWLRDGIMKTVPAYAILERVENGLGAGMADVNYVIRRQEGWIETKAVPLPKRPGTAVLGDKGLRDPAQINWHMARQVLGGRTWVFVTAKPYRWLVSGAHARNINAWTAEQLSAHAAVWVEGSWRDKDWKALVNALQR